LSHWCAVLEQFKIK